MLKLMVLKTCGTIPRRVMLKLSGEALQGGMGFGVDPKVSPAACTMHLRN